MRLKVTDPVKDYEDKPMLTSDDGGKTTREFTYREAIVTALNAVDRDEVMPPETKAKVYLITTKLYAKKEVDLTLSELTLIKERAGKILTPVVYGRLIEIIDPKADSKED